MTPVSEPVQAGRVPDRLGEAVLRAARGHHAFEGCVEQLATAIRLGVFPFGSTLPPERELAERMGVSRSTLREAIAALRTAGMVRTTRGRGGGTVVDFRPEAPAAGVPQGLGERRDELIDSLVFRRIVEPGASCLAASRSLSATERMLLTTALADVDQAQDSATHRQADSRLHLAIASVTGSPMTVAAVTEVQAGLHDMLQAIPVLEVNIEHSSRQHRAIVAAVLAGEPAKARRAMEQHCDDTAALLRGLLG
jgi:GntR family transcriptional regulator, transcriptional repressor for pyruvate dehydrogenase complex